MTTVEQGFTEFVVTTRPCHTFPQSTWGQEHGRFETIEEAESFANEIEVNNLCVIDVRELWTDPEGEVHEIN